MPLDIAAFMADLLRRKDLIDQSLESLLPPADVNPAVIHEAMHYAVFNGGKRLRPILVVEGAVIAGISQETVMCTACGLELLHCYSLVHDDLPAMDDDDYRRGKPTCHRVFGEANAILTGDALLTAAFELISRNADAEGVTTRQVLRVIREVAEAAGSRGMVGGQVLDLAAENKEIKYDDLKTLHSLKTGELFRASLRAGAILGNMDARGLQALTDYACQFGMAFQITDDILDVSGDQQLIGKPVGSDLKNHKTTYPSLFGLEGALKMARENVQNCLDSLSAFGAEANFLRDLAVFTLERQS